MQALTQIEQVRAAVKEWRQQGLTVGFVPTMGYLHQGHQSLIETAAKGNDKVVVSIFVNPMQFGPNEDFAQYPRDLQRDTQVCEQAGASLIFHPEPHELYPDGFCTHVDVAGLTEGLCGKTRPGHFRGVCTVVTKLLNIVQPDRAYFGQKDAQQFAVVRRMVRDLNMPVELIACPIIREPDGLAKSSRNTYLSTQERQAALVLYRALCEGRSQLQNGVRDANQLRAAMEQVIGAEPLAKLDYLELVDLQTLQPVTQLCGDTLVALAVYIGKTRLIDNFIYQGEQQ